MGFPSDVSCAAIREHESVQSAVDAILAGKGLFIGNSSICSYLALLGLPVMEGSISNNLIPRPSTPRFYLAAVEKIGRLRDKIWARKAWVRGYISKTG